MHVTPMLSKLQATVHGLFVDPDPINQDLRRDHALFGVPCQADFELGRQKLFFPFWQVGSQDFEWLLVVIP